MLLTTPHTLTHIWLPVSESSHDILLSSLLALLHIGLSVMSVSPELVEANKGKGRLQVLASC